MFSDSTQYIISTPSAVAQRKRRKKVFNILSIGFAVLAIGLVAKQWQPGEVSTEQLSSLENQPEKGVFSQLLGRNPSPSSQPSPNIDKAFLRDALSGYIEAGEFPSQIGLNNQNLYINYTLDNDLQKWAEARLDTYNPDYGVFVALDPDTGKILALANSRRDNQPSASLAFKATYPAASTFKIITAAAALEEGVANPNTIFSFNGKSTSLYKSQVFHPKENKWTRRMNFKTAFAKSVNPIFGRLGAIELGADKLLAYAQRFGFNAKFVSDFEFDNGTITLDTEDQWQAAETASGYTRRNTLSPIHGAAIAASIANGGKLISPSIIESVTDARNQVLYSSDQPQAIQVLSEQSAQSMQTLMNATMKVGTGRKTFRTFHTKQKYKDVITGGKSGHLSGKEPKGSYDWFIGYGERGTQKIAYAMLCINKEKWYVKSSKFARDAMEHFFKNRNTKITKQPEFGQQAETS
ncbi:MAG: penicillin-binding transpeptidase domain-containing protein [Arenicellales bacterium]